MVWWWCRSRLVEIITRRMCGMHALSTTHSVQLLVITEGWPEYFRVAVQPPDRLSASRITQPALGTAASISVHCIQRLKTPT